MKNSLSALLCLVLFSPLISTQLLAENNVSKELTELFEAKEKYSKSNYHSVDHTDPAKRTGKFPDISPNSYKEHADQLSVFLKKSQSFETSLLTDAENINNRIFQFQIKSVIENISFEDYLFPMSGDTGFYFSVLTMGDYTRISNAKEAQFYLEQLQDLPNYFDQWIANMQLGIKKAKVLPAIILVDLEKPLKTLLVDEAKLSSFYKPVKQLNKVMSAKLAKRYQTEIKNTIEKKVQPAVKKMINYLANTYIPAGRKSIAITDIPNGDAYYQSQINYYTTLNLTADEIHDIGLKEVARIRAEMDEVIVKTGFKGSFAEFLDFLRTDPQFYAKTPLELLKEASYIAKKMDGQLPKFFTKLPRQPYAVEPVPAAIAPRYTTGRYSGAPLDSKRAGEYWVNTYALEKRPLYVLEALTLHEAAPGHHLQSALSKELEDLPDFRRYSYISAYGEGWALYCEKLGIEAGFYQDAYSQFGRLTYEMWRAIRLVVDTGMHAKGWSRERAIELMESNTALSTHNVRTEIDRYIAWPGQALSYKMGEIKILELRAFAEKELGTDFDIRLFHDEILAHGSVPLDILESNVMAWLVKFKQKLADKKES
jgi:uncharacterized protein (DUF885 family)